MSATLEARPPTLVFACPWLVRALRAGRNVCARDRTIGAGANRNLVLDHLRGRETPLLPRRRGGVPFDTKNHARVHPSYEQRFGIAIPNLQRRRPSVQIVLA